MLIRLSNWIEFTLVFLVLILVFLYDLMSETLGFLDEFIGLMAFGVLFFYAFIKGRLIFYRKEYYILILLSFIIFLGLASNAYSHIIGHKTNPIAIFADLVNFSKAFVAYFAIRLLSNHFNSNIALEKLSRYTKIIFFILIFIILLDVIFNIYPKAPRYGFNSLELFFKHGSRYAFSFSFIFLVLLPKHYPKKIGFLILILLVGMLSLRVKYFGFVILSLIFIFYGRNLIRIPRAYFIYILLGIAILLFFLFREKIQTFFVFENMEDAWSRAVVTYYSFIIAFDFFPFGTGFGTFSSFYSGFYYSWVYDLYGISNVYGIKRAYWNFVADQYWPMVLGQFGYLGLLAMILVIYNYLTIFLINVKANINNKRYYLFLSSILGLLMLLIDSTSDSIFSQQRAVAMFIYFALVMNTINKQNENFTNK
ncbi:MAG TPA: hypothetical protein PLZ00_07275 [Mangrovimonas sp.]|nr:hypothetical protein [Mangrovimonas sp.]